MLRKENDNDSMNDEASLMTPRRSNGTISQTPHSVNEEPSVDERLKSPVTSSTSTIPDKNMYRVFDGSFLLALGK
jgi:hypothetical protein